MPQKFTAEERRSYLLEYDVSGQIAREFAKDKKIKLTTFYTWLSRRKKENKNQESSMLPLKKFVEVEPSLPKQPLASDVVPSSGVRFRASLGPIQMECDGLPDPKWLAKLAKAL